MEDLAAIAMGMFLLAVFCGIFLLVGLIFGVITFLTIRSHRAMTAGWTEFAQRTGMTFARGDLFRASVLSGDYRRRPAVITHYTRGGARHSRTYMSVRLTLASPPEAGFSITPAGVLDSLAGVLGVQDVKVGTPEFDKDFFIQSRPPEYIIGSLGPDLTLQDLIRQLRNEWFTCLALDKGFLTYYQHSIEESADQLERMISTLSEIADKIEVRHEKF